MTRDTKSKTLFLHTPHWSRHEEIIESFEKAWQRGERPLIDDHLGNEIDSHALLVELVHVDVEYQFKCGNSVRADDYLDRYPQLAQNPTIVADLRRTEEKWRERTNDSGTLATMPPSRHDDDALPKQTGGERVPTDAQYEVRDRIARGGLGEIHLGFDPDLGREVALKRLLPSQANHPDAQQRFLREARITSQLEHPGVVPIYGLGRDSHGRSTYVMRLIKGETLRQAIRRFHETDSANRARRDRSLQLRQLLNRFVSTCHTIAYAHSQGVLHRDLKPENVMLGEYGETLVVDWGLAKHVDENATAAREEIVDDNADTLDHCHPPNANESDSGTTQQGTVLGTPAFLSPEQAAGDTRLVGFASDVYSLGAILYVLLTGRPPYSDESIAAILHKIKAGALTPPRRLAKDAPPALEAICLKAMALNPADRYASASKLASDVDHWLANESVSAHRESWAQTAMRWIGRRRTLVSGIVAAILVATISLGVAALLLMRANDSESKARRQAEEETLKAQQARAQVEIVAWRHRIPLAHHLWLVNDVERARQLIANCPKAHRHWEWHYLRNTFHSELMTIQAHDVRAWAVAASPDGKTLASASEDKTIKLWDRATGKLIRALRGHDKGVTNVVFHPHGRLIASAAYDHTVKIWDAAAGRLIATLNGHRGTTWGLAFTANGDRLATASYDGSVKVWSTADWTERFTLEAHDSWARGVTFSPNGDRLATCGSDGAVKIWDVAMRKEILAIRKHQGSVLNVAWDPVNDRIASAGTDRIVKLWSAKSGKEIRSFSWHGGAVWGLDFSPDGKHLATSSDDRTICVWCLKGGDRFILRGHVLGIGCVRWTPDSEKLVSAADDGMIKLWNATPQQALCFREPGDLAKVVFSPDGKRFATAGQLGYVKIWDAATWKAIHALERHTNNAWGVAFSPDGKWLASSSDDRTIKIWDVKSGKAIHTLRGHQDGIANVVFSPDGNLLASASDDKTVKIWNPRTGKNVATLRGHKNWVWCVAFSPDGALLVSGSHDKTIKVWSTRDWSEVRTLRGHVTPVWDVVFSSDGKKLFSGSGEMDQAFAKSRGELFSWNVQTGERLRQFEVMNSPIHGLALSPDGTRLAAAGMDGKIQLLLPREGEVVLTLYHIGGPLNGVAFSKNGDHLLTVGGDLRVWNGSSK